MGKNLKRTLSAIIVLLMLLTSAPLHGFVGFELKASAKEKVAEAVIENTYADSSVAANSAEAFFAFFANATFDGCYGNQLTDVAKEIYDSLVKQFVTDKKTGEYDYTFETPFVFDVEISNNTIVMSGEFAEIDNLLACAAQIAMDAFLYDHPEVFWLKITSSSYTVSAYGTSSGGYVGEISEITIIPTELYSGATSKIQQYDLAVETALNSITVTESRKDTLESVHDYICDNAWYNLVNDSRVHSSEAFFIGDGGVVCEGYSKSFKVICDRLEIPCVLVSGDADGAHMWNYVQMEDGKWYLVDVTWDDQESHTYYTYFLANSNTVGFDGVTISRERTERNDFSGTGIFSFVYPSLSDTVYVPHVHEWNARYTVDIEPTCTEKGSKSIHCLTCSATKNETEISAKGHNWTAATCTTKKTCSTCGATDGSALGHSYTSKVTTEATCTTDGVKTYTCSRCSDSYTEAIAKLGHDEVPHEAKTATCTEKGWEAYVTCAKCSYTTYKESPATGHSFTEKIIDSAHLVSEATTESPAIYKYDCADCDTIGEKTFTHGDKLNSGLGKTSKITAIQNASAIKLTWTKVPDADGYRIFYKSGSTWKKYKDLTANTITISNLNAGTKFTFAVMAGKIVDGKVIWSDVYTTIETATKVVKPEKVTAAQNTSAIKLTWSKVYGADGYRIYYKSGSTWKKYKDLTANTITISNLNSGTKFTFAVRAGKIIDGKVIWSDTYTTITTATKAVKPEKVASEQNASSIRLTWTKCKGADGYRIYYKSGSSWKICVSTTNLTSHTFSKLNAGAKFTFAIRPYIKIGSVVIWSDYTQFTTATTPVATSKITATQTTSEVTLNWNKVNGVTHYRIYQKISGGWKALAYTSDLTYTIKNLTQNTEYTFAVMSYIKTDSDLIAGGYKQDTVKTKADTSSQPSGSHVAITDGGIKLYPITSAEAKAIFEKWGDPFNTYYEGKNAANKTVIFVKSSSGWIGIDLSGAEYDAYGNIRYCQYCGQPSGRGDSMCNGCLIIG